MENRERNILIEEIAKFNADYGDRQAGDVSALDLVEEKGCNRNTAMLWMKKMAKEDPEHFQMVRVARDWHMGGGAWMWVLRRREGKEENVATDEHR